MSGHGRSQTDVDELLQIGTRCTQLRKEKELLKESRPQSFGLIRSLEEHVNSLSAERSEDKKRIEMLEKELRNCSQEIDFLQDQLNLRDTDVNLLEEHVKSLELRLRDTDMLHYEVSNLREELNRSDSECLLFMRELESREVELQNSSLCIEKLRESISAITLDSQCEIESMKLDVVALEQNYIEAEKGASRERARMNQSILELEARYQDIEKINACLEFENKELKEKLDTSEMKFRVYWQRLEKWLEKHGSFVNIKVLVNELENKLLMSKEEREEKSEEVLSPMIVKLETILRSDCDVVEEFSKQIEGYELLVKQLKENLREEKLKAKEEAEDLAQEMAELRYQMTGLLEEERKRRVHIEQASTQRIAELEGKVKQEQEDSANTVRESGSSRLIQESGDELSISKPGRLSFTP